MITLIACVGTGVPTTLSQGPPPSTHSNGSTDQRVCRNKRKNPVITGEAQEVGPTRARKERDPNWSRLEMVSLVCANRAEFMEEL
jgi:hypothetical protein